MLRAETAEATLLKAGDEAAAQQEEKKLGSEEALETKNSGEGMKKMRTPQKERQGRAPKYQQGRRFRGQRRRGYRKLWTCAS